MKAARYATSRQKACGQCSAAKAKCDRKNVRCTRCTMRGLSCTYPQAVPSGGTPVDLGRHSQGIYNLLSSPASLPASKNSHLSPESDQIARFSTERSSLEPTEFIPAEILTTPHVEINPRSNAAINSAMRSEIPDFSGLELHCSINADDISNRWLNPYIPVPGQKVKQYTPAITSFIDRILKSYAAITVRGRGYPPFVHHLQVTSSSTSPPLATCLTLVRVCEKTFAGSDTVAADVLQREMENLYQQHATYDDVTQLAAFQAYLIYSMVLFFTLNVCSRSFLRQAVVSLQDLACSSSRGGLVCVAEQQRARPKWEAWTVAEAKRRTLFTMYLFDSLLSAQDGLPSFVGTELHGLQAPANKCLWRAQYRYEWETRYNVYLADWPAGGLTIDELWPSPPHLDEAGLLGRRSRVEQWLEDVDEFGTMLYAVTSCTHGS